MVNPLRPIERQELGSSRQSDPLGLMRLRDQMDRLFENTLRDFGFPMMIPVVRETEFLPDINIKESNKKIDVTVDVPGIKPENIDVAIEENSLVIRGEREEEQVEEDERMYVCERSWGRFERSITLPEGADREGVQAQYDNGVLSITIPKTEQAQRAQKKIQVRTAQPQMTGGEQPVSVSQEQGEGKGKGEESQQPADEEAQA